LSDLEFDSENELDDCAILDVVMDDNIDEDDDDIQDCLWEDMKNYKKERKNFRCSIEPQGAAK
jgi:isopentenyldiphosphate isomerase